MWTYAVQGRRKSHIMERKRDIIHPEKWRKCLISDSVPVSTSSSYNTSQPLESVKLRSKYCYNKIPFFCVWASLKCSLIISNNKYFKVENWIQSFHFFKVNHFQILAVLLLLFCLLFYYFIIFGLLTNYLTILVQCSTFKNIDFTQPIHFVHEKTEVQ